MGVTYVSSLVCGLGVFGVLKVVPWGGVRSARAMFSGVSGIGSGMACFAGLLRLWVSVIVVLFSCVLLCGDGGLSSVVVV